MWKNIRTPLIFLITIVVIVFLGSRRVPAPRMGEEGRTEPSALGPTELRQVEPRTQNSGGDSFFESGSGTETEQQGGAYVEDRRPRLRHGPGGIASNYLYLPESRDPATQSPSLQRARARILKQQIENRGGDIILADTSRYEIAYIPTPNIFLVTIRSEPVETIKREQEEWFMQFGLSPQDLCDLPVRFLLSAYTLRAANPDFVSLPSGCNVP
jgi:hypothetical protein